MFCIYAKHISIFLKTFTFTNSLQVINDLPIGKLLITQHSLNITCLGCVVYILKVVLRILRANSLIY